MSSGMIRISRPTGKFEACLGFDPDEAEPETIERLLTDCESLGEAAMTEIAAHHPFHRSRIERARPAQEARSAGFDYESP